MKKWIALFLAVAMLTLAGCAPAQEVPQTSSTSVQMPEMPAVTEPEESAASEKTEEPVSENPEEQEKAEAPEKAEEQEESEVPEKQEETAAEAEPVTENPETEPEPAEETLVSLQPEEVQQEEPAPAAAEEPEPEPAAAEPEEQKQPMEPQDVSIGTEAYTCTISISCATILNNLSLCSSEKVGFVPGDGWLLQPMTVPFYEGESVFNVLQRTCKQQKIHMEFMNTPIYNSAYIEGIGNLYEFDVGELSGWMYKVNGWFPNYGCSRYVLENGDKIEWLYTCDLGADVGEEYALGHQKDE